MIRSPQLLFEAEDAKLYGAMIFVRNDHGSHNPHEAMALEDFGEACRLLFGLLEQLV